jgi:hypothetical protein
MLISHSALLEFGFLIQSTSCLKRYRYSGLPPNENAAHAVMHAWLKNAYFYLRSRVANTPFYEQTNVSKVLPIQPIDATHSLNFSAGEK